MATILQQNVPLSQAFIWDLQAKFYQSLGVDAWLSGIIPSRVTTNSYIAWRFARMIASYLADVGARNATIVELGAGHGRFGFLCASHLQRMTTADTLANVNWQYVLTDVAERNIDFYQQHQAFRSLVKEHRIDFARYEAGVDQTLKLRRSGLEISSAQPVEHLIVVANYFFDSLPMDVWQVRGGELAHCSPIISLRENATITSMDDPKILEQIDLTWAKPVPSQPNYANPEWNQVVHELADEVGNGTFMLPVGALQTLKTTESWSAGPMMLLTADKGYPHASDYRDRPLPTMIQHGCFSFSLNFASLGAWFCHNGGFALLPEQRNGLIETAAYVSRGILADLPRTCFEAESLNQLTPAEYHQITRRCENTDLDLQACLGLIKLSCFEPLIAHRLRRIIRAQIPSASSLELEMLHEVLTRTHENYYHLNECDLPFTLAFIFQKMGDHQRALTLYDESLKLFGAHPSTYLNRAICQQSLGLYVDALASIQFCIEQTPNDSVALAMQHQLFSQIQQQQAESPPFYQMAPISITPQAMPFQPY